MKVFLLFVVVFIAQATSASAWNYMSITYYRLTSEAKGKMAFTRFSEFRNGPESSAFQDNERWQREAVALIGGKGSLTAAFGIGVQFPKSPEPTVLIDLSHLDEGASKTHGWKAATVLFQTMVCIQLTVHAQSKREVKIKVTGSNPEMVKKYGYISGVYVMGRKLESEKKAN